ncbi:MAG: transposase [Ekhidna sp.]|nr:transposase [Ekhidna sp.]
MSYKVSSHYPSFSDEAEAIAHAKATWQKKRNVLISKQGYKVERTFGSIKEMVWFRHVQGLGIAKTHTLHLLETIACNLKRSPDLVTV